MPSEKTPREQMLQRAVQKSIEECPIEPGHPGDLLMLLEQFHELAQAVKESDIAGTLEQPLDFEMTVIASSLFAATAAWLGVMLAEVNEVKDIPSAH